MRSSPNSKGFFPARASGSFIPSRERSSLHYAISSISSQLQMRDRHMTFHSILFARTEDYIQEETLDAPDFFADLNLDQVIDAITAGRKEYHLKPFFYTPLKDIDAITYRHDILRDFENHVMFEHIQ